MARSSSEEIDQVLKWFKLTSLYVLLAIMRNPFLNKLYRLVKSKEPVTPKGIRILNSKKNKKFWGRWKDFMNLDIWNPPTHDELLTIIKHLSLIVTEVDKNDFKKNIRDTLDDDTIIVQINLRRPRRMITHFVDELVTRKRRELGISTDMVIHKLKYESLDDKEEYLDTYLKYLSSGRQIEMLVEKAIPDISDRRRAADERRKIRNYIKKTEDTITTIEQRMLSDCKDMKI